VEIDVSFAWKKVTVRPLRHGIVPERTPTGIRFALLAPAKISVESGVISPRGSGRPRVRAISASIFCSTRQLKAAAAPATRAMPIVAKNTTPEKLREFTVGNGMNWRHVYDQQGWQSPIAAKFFVYSIPAPFLVGRDGKVAAVSEALRGERLARTIEAAL
jgi:hypothetical protein